MWAVLKVHDRWSALKRNTVQFFDKLYNMGNLYVHMYECMYTKRTKTFCTLRLEVEFEIGEDI